MDAASSDGGLEDLGRRGHQALAAGVAGHGGRRCAAWSADGAAPDASSLLVLVGRHDSVCAPAAGRALAAGIPGAQVERPPGTFRLFEAPEPFLEAVRAYLARLAS